MKPEEGMGWRALESAVHVFYGKDNRPAGLREWSATLREGKGSAVVRSDDSGAIIFTSSILLSFSKGSPDGWYSFESDRLHDDDAAHIRAFIDELREMTPIARGPRVEKVKEG